VFLRVQEEQGAFTVRFLMRTYDWFSGVSIISIVSPYKTRTISYMHIFSIFGRLYHINSEINVHIFSIFGRLYHINSETDMHIFSCLGRLYHINSQIFVYAFAPGRVLF